MLQSGYYHQSSFFALQYGASCVRAHPAMIILLYDAFYTLEQAACVHVSIPLYTHTCIIAILFFRISHLHVPIAVALLW